MKERPILFSGPMVRAILDGRKTMTRRTRGMDKINEEPDAWVLVACKGGNEWLFRRVDSATFRTVKCPYGQPGDRLWLRETWRNPDGLEYLAYKADVGTTRWRECIDETRCKWTPSIHMPRWASRITLEVTGVRVERLQDITWDDAESEGVQCVPTEDSEDSYWCIEPDDERGTADRPDDAFSFLWESINGAGSWNANPWVWVVEFKRVEK